MTWWASEQLWLKSFSGSTSLRDRFPFIKVTAPVSMRNFLWAILRRSLTIAIKPSMPERYSRERKPVIYKYLVCERREASPSGCCWKAKLFMSWGGEPAKRRGFGLTAGWELRLFGLNSQSDYFPLRLTLNLPLSIALHHERFYRSGVIEPLCFLTLSCCPLPPS